MEKITTRQILNLEKPNASDFEFKKYNASDFEMERIQCARFQIYKYSSCQILTPKIFIFFDLKSFRNPTTCTFHNVSLQITMCNYSRHFFVN